MKKHWLMALMVLGLVGAASAAEVGRKAVSGGDMKATTGPGSSVVGGSGNPAVGLQLALLAPAQVFPENYDVFGLRLNLIYGRNNCLRGLDLGLVNVVSQDLAGAQIGLYNACKTSNEGCFQFGIINNADQFSGMQFGLLNLSGQAHGLQLGVLNMCDTMDGGIQIGLLNFIVRSEYLVFCPLFNAQF